ncbi:MAG: hypothetical protein RR846_07205 [Oscillospiraceae bacterium]
MKHIIVIFLAVMAICFTSCAQGEKPVKYNTTICDSELSQIFNEIKSTRSPENKIEFQDFSKYDLLDFISSTTDENLLSLTVCSEKLSDDDVLEIISFVRAKNIPVIFICQSVDNKVLATYDKAFCITTDYVYAAEVFAGDMFARWRDGSIVDRDENKIFSFTVLKEETSPPYLDTFYKLLVENLEIYGIPLQLNEEVFPSTEEVSGILEADKATNEGFLIFSDDILNAAVESYQPIGEGLELFSIYRGTANKYADYSDGKICYIDYLQYFAARDEIIKNYTNRLYPLSELSFPVNNKTVYIPPTI